MQLSRRTCFAGISGVIKGCDLTKCVISLFLSPHLITFPDVLLVKSTSCAQFVSSCNIKCLCFFSPLSACRRLLLRRRRRGISQLGFFYSRKMKKEELLRPDYRCSWKKKNSLQKEFQCLKF